MSYMEQQMQQHIEAGLSEADRCYTRIRELEDKNAALSAQIEIMQGNFEHILHYWNRDNNQQAMENACWMAINTSAEMLEITDSECLVSVKKKTISDFIKWATTNVDPEFAEWQDFADKYAEDILK